MQIKLKSKILEIKKRININKNLLLKIKFKNRKIKVKNMIVKNMIIKVKNMKVKAKSMSKKLK